MSTPGRAARRPGPGKKGHHRRTSSTLSSEYFFADGSLNLDSNEPPSLHELPKPTTPGSPNGAGASGSGLGGAAHHPLTKTRDLLPEDPMDPDGMEESEDELLDDPENGEDIQTVGPFKLGKVLGRGVTGVVRVAVNMETGFKVA